MILLLWARIPRFTVESTIELDLGLDSRSRAGIIFRSRAGILSRSRAGIISKGNFYKDGAFSKVE